MIVPLKIKWTRPCESQTTNTSLQVVTRKLLLILSFSKWIEFARIQHGVVGIVPKAHTSRSSLCGLDALLWECYSVERHTSFTRSSYKFHTIVIQVSHDRLTSFTQTLHAIRYLLTIKYACNKSSKWRH